MFRPDRGLTARCRFDREVDTGTRRDTLIARLFSSSYLTYAVVAIFIAIVISFGLQAVGVDAKVAQIISWVWLLLAYFVRHRQSSVDHRDAG